MIEEASLYANLHVETSPIATTATWTDHIASVRDISLTRGGVEDLVGVSNVQPGSGTISLVDFAGTIAPGYWVRIRYSSSIIWAGYVQDVNVSYTFIYGETYAVTTLTVLDWAAWIAQFSTGGLDSAWYLQLRIQDINSVADGNPLITHNPGGIPPAGYVFDELLGDRSLSEVLDISATTINGYWKSVLNVPTGSGLGIGDIIDLYNQISSSNIALTDGTHTGSPTNLMNYVDLEVATRTSQVSNSVVIQNHWGLNAEDTVVSYSASDSTSIAAYGSRLATIETNTPVSGFLAYEAINLSTMPSFEGTDYELTSTNFYTSIEQPALDAGGAWSAYSGTNALRAYNLAGTGTNTSQGWNERIRVTAGTTYYAIAYAATTGSGSIRARTRIDWYNEANTLLSTSYGSFVSLSSFKTWYKTSTSAAAPTNAVFARVTVYFDRGGASTFVTGTKLWVDGVYFGTTNVTNWFDGNTADSSSYLYFWRGDDNSSTSQMVTNNLTDISTSFLNSNKTAFYSPFTARLNAQANLTAAVLIDLYKSVYIWFNSHRWTSVVTGITHNININPDGTTRWTIDLDIRPSAYTI